MIEQQSAPSDVRDVLETLPVQPSTAQSLKDLIAQDRPEAESAPFQFLLKAMSWTLYAIALGAVGLLTWTIFGS
jgi:hypothetical protein